MDVTATTLVAVGSVLIGVVTGRAIRDRGWSLTAAIVGSMAWAAVVVMASR